MSDELKVSNFIFILSKYMRMNYNDLKFAYKTFLEEEHYEKCSVIKELLDLNFVDSQQLSHSKIFKRVIRQNIILEELTDKYKDLNKQSLQIQEGFWNNIKSLIEFDSKEEKSKYIDIPFTKKKNYEYLYKYHGEDIVFY